MDLQNVILHPLLYAAFKKFITVTKQALNVQKGYVFLTIDGRAMDSSLINKSLQAAWRQWQRCSGVNAPHITAGVVRKTIVSITRDKGNLTQEQLHELARHMDHSYETASKYYNLTNGLSVSSRSAHIITTMFRIKENAFEDEDKDTHDAGEESEDGREEQQEEEEPEVPRKRKKST